VSAEPNDNTSHGAGESAFGPGQDEVVFAPGKYPPRPDVRTRVAPIAGTGALTFEPEVDGQEEALRAFLAPAPAPQSGLAFEPEAGGALDRLASRGPAPGAARPGQDDIDTLIALAGGHERAGAEPVPAGGAPPPSPAIPPPLDAAAGQAAFRGRSSVAGDIEAELFGPKAVGVSGASGPMPSASAPPSAPPGAAAAEPDGEPPPTQSVGSVFLSERVLGRRRRRKTTGLLRRSAHFRAVADRWFGRAYRSVRRTLRGIDRVTGMARLPLANIVWAAAIAALSLAFGLALPFAGGVLAAGLILTIAGQPARNLLGIAGIMILSASLAEVVRQRERFIEIFLDLFG
jgi:hypothetical protein